MSLSKRLILEARCLGKKRNGSMNMNDTTALLSLLKLRLNIEHPSVEESYVYGYDAAAAGVPEEDNPFQLNTREYDHWSEGWWAGFYDEKPIFSLDETVDSQSAPQPLQVANDHIFSDTMGNLLVKVLEISSVIGVAALVGYQVLELVA